MWLGYESDEITIEIVDIKKLVINSKTLIIVN